MMVPSVDMTPRRAKTRPRTSSGYQSARSEVAGTDPTLAAIWVATLGVA